MTKKVKFIELLSDQSINTLKEDKFDRQEFVNSVAEIIHSQSTKVNPKNIPEFKKVEENMIIGLYGTWGFGKSSILNLLKENLEDRSLQCVYFNPWMYGNEDQLLISLFNTLVSYSGLDKDNKKILVELLNKYHPLISVVSKTSSQLAKGLAIALSPDNQTNAFYYKQEIDKILTGAANPITIFIDDVDRLSKNEIHVLFKTLRLIASFKHVVYVIACDYEMVSKSIKENYADGKIEDGRSFIDKIIQVPIRIPEIKPLKLVIFAIDHIKLNVDVDLSGNTLFSQIIEVFFHTPRDIKRFINGFRFTKNYLGNSVKVIDLIFLELIRIKIHGLFEIIRIYYIALNSTDPEVFYAKKVRNYFEEHKPHFYKVNNKLNFENQECFMYHKIFTELFNSDSLGRLDFIINHNRVKLKIYRTHESIINQKNLRNPQTIIDYFENTGN